MKAFGDTQTPVQALENFTEGFVGLKPLFSGGVQIGQWTSAGGYFDVNAADVMANLCQGVVTLNPGLTAAQQDPNSWTTVDDWWMPISVNDYCMQKHVVPTWFSQAQANTYVATTSGSFLPASNSLLVPLAVGGALVLLSLFMIARR